MVNGLNFYSGFPVVLTAISDLHKSHIRPFALKNTMIQDTQISRQLSALPKQGQMWKEELIPQPSIAKHLNPQSPYSFVSCGKTSQNFKYDDVKN